MSSIQSRVGSWKFKWKQLPRGNEGAVQVELQTGKTVDVRWKRDADGIWVQLPYGIFGYDLHREWDENGQVLYHLAQRGSDQEWSQVPFFRGDETATQATSGSKAKAARVRAQMPGKIIRVMVEPGQLIQKDQPALVMEAMKMENEIRSPLTGKVSQVKVKEGQAVESGADLLLIEPEAI